jgi:hypothetical protein
MYKQSRTQTPETRRGEREEEDGRKSNEEREGKKRIYLHGKRGKVKWA